MDGASPTNDTNDDDVANLISQTRPDVVMGSFNGVPDFLDQLGFKNVVPEDDFLPTSSSGECVDHIYVRREIFGVLKWRRIARDGWALSRHHAICAWIEWKTRDDEVQ